MRSKHLVVELLAILDDAYERKAWHGPNLKGALRGVAPGEAGYRPAPGRHSIRELTLHAAYWKYAVWRRLTGEKRGSFPLNGSNWFPRSGVPSAREWQKDRQLLEAQHRRVRATVAMLSRPPSRALLRQIYGIALHDVYHAAQIQYVKKLFRGRQRGHRR